MLSVVAIQAQEVGRFRSVESNVVPVLKILKIYAILLITVNAGHEVDPDLVLVLLSEGDRRQLVVVVQKILINQEVDRSLLQWFHFTASLLLINRFELWGRHVVYKKNRLFEQLFDSRGVSANNFDT